MYVFLLATCIAIVVDEGTYDLVFFCGDHYENITIENKKNDCIVYKIMIIKCE